MPNMAKYGSYEGFLGPGTRNLHPIPTFQVGGLAFKKNFASANRQQGVSRITSQNNPT